MATKAATLTIKQACAGFGVSGMCLSNWRAGTATKAALPSSKDGAAVVLKEADVLKWAKKHEVEFDLAKAYKVQAVKSGPKEKAPRKAVKSARGKSANTSIPRAKAADARARRSVSVEVATAP